MRSSNAREILCLVSKILCVVRYKGGWDFKGGTWWDKVSAVAKASYSDLLRSIATQVERVEEKTGTKKRRQIKIN